MVRPQRLREAPEAGIIFLLYSTVSEIQKGEATCPRSQSMSTLGPGTSCPQKVTGQGCCRFKTLASAFKLLHDLAHVTRSQNIFTQKECYLFKVAREEVGCLPWGLPTCPTLGLLLPLQQPLWKLRAFFRMALKQANLGLLSPVSRSGQDSCSESSARNRIEPHCPVQSSLAHRPRSWAVTPWRTCVLQCRAVCNRYFRMNE